MVSIISAVSSGFGSWLDATKDLTIDLLPSWVVSTRKWLAWAWTWSGEAILRSTMRWIGFPLLSGVGREETRSAGGGRRGRRRRPRARSSSDPKPSLARLPCTIASQNTLSHLRSWGLSGPKCNRILFLLHIQCYQVWIRFCPPLKQWKGLALGAWFVSYLSTAYNNLINSKIYLKNWISHHNIACITSKQLYGMRKGKIRYASTRLVCFSHSIM